MEVETEQLLKEVYKAAGVYGKIVTVPELAQLISREGDKNPIVRMLLEQFTRERSDFYGYPKIVLGHVNRYDWRVDCSDGKKRKHISLDIRRISIIIEEISEVEVLGVDDKNPDKCYSAQCYISQSDLEYLLLTDEERAKVSSARLVLAKEKILALFKKGFKSVTPEVIERITGLNSERYKLALDELVNVDKKLRPEGGAYVLNKN